MSATTPDGTKAHAVTGAFGFSGKYIAGQLLEAGKRVVTLTGSPDRPNPFSGRVEARPFAFNNITAMTESLRDVEVLYNTYWVRFNHGSFTYAAAVRNTLALFEAAKTAGVERVVHVSITNADTKSPYEYFSSKGHLENALKASGLNYAIVRPAVLFGPEDILVNNIAWAVRLFPVFCLFGNGEYSLRPVHVEDFAAQMVGQGQSRECATVNALGPESFRYRDMIAMIAEALGKKRRLVSIKPEWALHGARILSKLLGDVLITPDEVHALMDGLLDVPDAGPSGTIPMSDWVRDNSRTLGRVYHSELDRRLDRKLAY